MNRIFAAKSFYLWMGLIFFLLMGLLPLLALHSDSPGERSSSDETGITETDYFTIYDESSGNILTVPDNAFLPAAVACEMPLTYEDEALRAQAVAAYTVYDYQRAQRRSSARDGADFTCNTQTWNIYTTEEQMRSRWGDQYDAYLSRLRSVLENVQGIRLTYQGDRVMSTYYAISSGMTEASADIWGGSLDYLIPVDSSWDLQAPEYQTTVSVNSTVFCEKLAAQDKTCVFSGVASDWIGTAERTSSGTVQQIKLGETTFSGSIIQFLFGLRAQNFDLRAENNTLIFTVRGYGHGVGMSQYGANCMAASGSNYAEILAHYYPGTQIFCAWGMNG